MTTNTTHAIVIGGSMAGLLTARVLSDHFNRVTIIERDQLPQSADFRGGVPQARHLHTLLVKGQRIMEDLFPGFNEDMLSEGAVPMTWGKDTHFVTTGGYVKHFESTIKSNSFARASLEWLVRRRVSAISTIDFLPETQVERLLTNEDRSIVM
ncbi:MAG: FAD-dependent monooxygenase, partial [Chitinophagaceae bacterium]|nr:FAD-dependent monooxygenase [Anaerolineae bacterium]